MGAKPDIFDEFGLTPVHYLVSPFIYFNIDHFLITKGFVWQIGFVASILRVGS